LARQAGAGRRHRGRGLCIPPSWRRRRRLPWKIGTSPKPVSLEVARGEGMSDANAERLSGGVPRSVATMHATGPDSARQISNMKIDGPRAGSLRELPVDEK
jgi:hypothetical protein